MEGLEIEPSRSQRKTAKALPQIAEVIQAGKSLKVHINGHRVKVPDQNAFQIVLAESGEGEIEIEMRWDTMQGR